MPETPLIFNSKKATKYFLSVLFDLQLYIESRIVRASVFQNIMCVCVCVISVVLDALAQLVEI